jgi:putative transposase
LVSDTPSAAWLEGTTMTETIDPMDASRIDTQQFAQALVEQARSEGVELIGPGGLLTAYCRDPLV